MTHYEEVLLFMTIIGKKENKRWKRRKRRSRRTGGEGEGEGGREDEEVGKPLLIF